MNTIPNSTANFNGGPVDRGHPIVTVLRRLRGVQQSGDGYVACCPAHHDSTPSLSVTEGRDGRVLLHCFVGCDLYEITEALELEVSDLFPRFVNANARHRRRRPHVTQGTSTGIPVADETVTDFGGQMQVFRSQLHESHLAELAEALQLPQKPLREFDLGWSAVDGVGPFWAIAEQNADGTVIGVIRRYCDGQQRALQGGKRGLIFPAHWDKRSGPILIPEGFSDTLALTSQGLPAIGRPSASGGVNLLAQLFAQVNRDVIIVGENDQKLDGRWPGRTAAINAALKLTSHLGREVRWVLPPAALKDVRELVIQGGNWHVDR